jgi:hypothetical protein
MLINKVVVKNSVAVELPSWRPESLILGTIGPMNKETAFHCIERLK